MKAFSFFVRLIMLGLLLSYATIKIVDLFRPADPPVLHLQVVSQVLKSGNSHKVCHHEEIGKLPKYEIADIPLVEVTCDNVIIGVEIKEQ